MKFSADVTFLDGEVRAGVYSSATAEDEFALNLNKTDFLVQHGPADAYEPEKLIPMTAIKQIDNQAPVE